MVQIIPTTMDGVQFRATSLSLENDLNKRKITDYTCYLTSRNIPSQVSSPYLILGKAQQVTPWLLHISVLEAEVGLLLDRILGFLISADCSLIIPDNINTHASILNGSFGYQHVAKVITIYTGNSEALLTVTRFLVEATKGIEAPEIPDGIRLNNSLYASKSGDHRGFSKADKKTWPFGSIAPFQLARRTKWLTRKYFKVSILKFDVKGNVYKALNLSRWTDIQWCIIKQGKRHQCTDSSGRNVTDRLKWQYSLQSKISKSIPVPKPIDLIEEGGDIYFVMEYIEGESYNDLISTIQKGLLWFAMAKSEQIDLLDTLLKIIDVVEQFHAAGIVHRDLNPVNFIVRPDKCVAAIDIELSYDLLANLPSPAFALGTNGYMSPDQRAQQLPCIADDVFGLGGLLVRTFTGLSPAKFNLSNGYQLSKKLNYFIRNPQLSEFIVSCFHDEKLNLPSVEEIKQRIEGYRSFILTNSQIESPGHNCTFSNDLVRDVINGALVSFFKGPFLKNDCLWRSKTKSECSPIGSEIKNLSWYPDFSNGTAGILYLLGKAKLAGYSLDSYQDIWDKNTEHLLGYLNSEASANNVGLYSGNLGAALIMAKLVDQGIINPGEANRTIFRNILSDLSFGLQDGISGFGLALIQFSGQSGDHTFDQQASEIAGSIIRRQRKNGSWKMAVADHVRPFGFLHGISGIIYFLMIYAQQYNDENANRAVLKGLGQLLKERKKVDGKYNWPVSTGGAIDPWFENGFTGIAFLFLKAWEVYRVDHFKHAAIEALRFHPAEITSNYISQANGLCGVGEVYLEASRILGDSEWMDRASNIVDFLCHINKEDSGGCLYWLDGSDELPDPNFMDGHAGILHFLLRFQNPHLIGFPLISF